MTLDRALAIFLAVTWAVFIFSMFAAWMAAVGCELFGMPWGCGL